MKIENYVYQVVRRFCLAAFVCGESVKETPKRGYSEDTKAAVIVDLLQGQSVSGIAKKYNVPRSTIQGWRDGAGLNRSAVTVTKKKEIGDLILVYMNVGLVALTKQAEKFSDENWLDKQSANDAAILHGVLADKIIRLLEALARREAQEETESV